MKIINCEQRSDEWYEVRLGVPSASSFDKLITMKGEPSKQAEKYLYKLAGEKVSGIVEDTYQNGAMIRGCELEDEARELYQFITGNDVEQVGFCLTDYCGCSPDGLIGDDGGLEIKCPNMATHVEYLLNGGLPSTYYQQVHGSMYVTGRKWWDFMSYYPNIKPFIVRVERDEAFMKAFDAQIKQFSQRLNEVINQIT